MAGEILVKADKINRRKKTIKYTKIISLVLFVLLTVIFVVLSVIYKGGKFVITLDPNSELESDLIIYDNHEDRQIVRRLYADEMPFMDNISIKWIPQDIDTEKDGSHNGKNYIAYTFYVENTGKENVDYWYEIILDDVIKRVDEAVRIMIFVNGDRTVYAKKNGDTKKAEPDTTPFYEGIQSSSETVLILEHREKLVPKKADRITVVVWLEGDDPDCINAIIGGEIKMHMNIREEHYDTTNEKKEEAKKKEEEKKKKEESKKEETKEEENKDEQKK